MALTDPAYKIAVNDEINLRVLSETTILNANVANTIEKYYNVAIEVRNALGTYVKQDLTDEDKIAFANKILGMVKEQYNA